ncbi:MAG TPA: STAS domain-containing protein [Solirubrobacteraceae bacterium]|nr:STAS domain-containing protein [Solirubrobacteraceae bacterium]
MMNLDVARSSVPTVAPRGALDLSSSRGLQVCLAELAGENGQEAILDLSRVSFMDSVGLGVVLKAASRFHRQGKRLLIVAPAGPAGRVLEFAGVSDRLPVVDSLDEARAQLRHG